MIYKESIDKVETIRLIFKALLAQSIIVKSTATY